MNRCRFPISFFVTALGIDLCLATGISAESSTPEAGFDIRRDATVEAIEKVLPGVVNIAVQGYNGEESGGSGVVVDEDGYVLTNAHVIRDARQIWVKFNDDSAPYPAEKLELTRAKDVALLRLRAPVGRRFRAVKFAKDDDLLLGETVIALGNPFGLGGSVSRGIISSKSRRRPEEVPPGEFLEIADWLQTDASINPGNSGGPLINLRGEMVGLSVAVLRPDIGAQGIGFAIPIKIVSSALAEILTGESLQGNWFGARLRAATRPLTVQVVQPGSPAEKAGLRVEDVIVQANGVRPETVIDFNRILQASGDREDVRIVVSQNGKERKLTLRMLKEVDFFNTELVRRRLGMTVKPNGNGTFIIGDIERGGPAGREELESGLTLATVDDIQVSTVVEFARIVHRKAKGETIKLGILAREGRGFFSRYVVAPVLVKTR
ncbi:MAG: PDZ domain-containing protein [Pedosphaera sp.]|nr:PDZ domain-containing protein [Pedosphaera sp.]